MTKLIDGAPELAPLTFVAPTAAAPVGSDEFTPLKAITVMLAGTACDNEAVTIAADTGATAKALQTSAVPNCELERTTNVHVNPAPVTLLTFMPEEIASAEMNANKSSLLLLVENALLLMVVVEEDLSAELATSIPTLAQELEQIRSKLERVDRSIFIGRSESGF